MTRGCGSGVGVHRGLAGGWPTRMLGLYAAAQGLPADTFGLGALPHLRLTVNDYPTWTYPEVTEDEDKLLLLEHADDSAVTDPGPAGRLRGAADPGAGRELDPGAGHARARCRCFSGSLLARWTGGRLRPGQHRVVAGGTVTRRSTAVFVYPALRRGGRAARPVGRTPIRDRSWSGITSRTGWRTTWPRYGRPDQIAAWRDGQPYVAELAENSAGLR